MSVRKSPGKETKEENPRNGIGTLGGKKHTQTCPLPDRWRIQALFCIRQNQSGSSGGNKKYKKGTQAGLKPLLQGPLALMSWVCTFCCRPNKILPV